MAERFLEVEVSRSIFTTVNVVIDDTDPRFSALFDPSGNVTHHGFKLLEDAAHKAASKTVQEYDWEKDATETEINGYKEVQRAEAVAYKVWDARKDNIFAE